MQQGRASRTAEYMALFRALETSRPASQRLFADPFALGFLGTSLGLAARLGAVPGLRGWVAARIDSRVPGARTSAIARTRFIDDAIADLPEPVEQLVILGAGFDARAHRLPALRNLRVFEVDHPDTLRRKRALLERAVSAPPAQVRYVATDFHQEKLEAAMAEAGYVESARTLFLWEGVTNYLSESAVDTTLRWCARAAAGSRVLFTYVHADVIAAPASFDGTGRLAASLAKFGERWTFGLAPARLAAFLAERGLVLERDVGASDYRALCFGEDAARSMKGYEFYRIALARVGAPPSAER